MVHFYFILEDFIITLHIVYKEIIFREKQRVNFQILGIFVDFTIRRETFLIPFGGCIWVRMEVKFCGAIIILEYKRAVISELRWSRQQVQSEEKLADEGTSEGKPH